MAASSAACSVHLAGLLLPRLETLLELVFQLAPAVFQPAGDLGQEVVPVLDARPDVAGAVLKLALTLKIQGVEQHLGDGFRIFLGDEPLRQLPGDSLVCQQFLQINSNKKTALGGQRKGVPGIGIDAVWSSFDAGSCSGLLCGPVGPKRLGRDRSRFWTAPREHL